MQISESKIVALLCYWQFDYHQQFRMSIQFMTRLHIKNTKEKKNGGHTLKEYVMLYSARFWLDFDRHTYLSRTLKGTQVFISTKLQ